MRELSLFLLLASAAVPALAAPGDDDRGSRHNRDSKSEQAETRSQRLESPSERAATRQQSEGRSDRAIERQQSRSERAEQRQLRVQRAEVSEPTRQDSVEPIPQRNLEQRRRATSAQSEGNDSARDLRPRERQIRTIPDTRPQVAQPSREERRVFADRNRRDYRDGKYKRWSNDWRDDRRYDWRDYRNRYRSIFRLRSYYDPFGWNYRRWSTGSFLWPSYYSQSYWLNDPWHYRLPPAYGPYRWVRYWDDALMVNIYTGQVVDVLHNFFW
jgi:hypothetical protein